MKTKMQISILFIIAAIYDGVLGILFLFAANTIFQLYQVTPPNHLGYVQFPGALLVVFALMFLAVAINPVRNKNLIPYGILLKVSYCAIVFYHWFTAGIPSMWKPFAILDLIFMILFVWTYLVLTKGAKTV